MPARSHSFTSCLWALGLGLYIWLGGVAIGWSRAMAFIIAIVSGFAIFVLVRNYGEDEPRRP
jgi:hypothetical protein